ncbi:MAG: cytochrome c peroxidase [Neisseria sp.]|nr:cytochrome c peroxidase [Neisseria sp.]
MKRLNTLRTAAWLSVFAALSACNDYFPAEKAASNPQTATASAASQAAPAAVSTEDQDLLKQAQGLFKPLPDVKAHQKEMGFTDEQVQLGKQLYYEPRLSLANDISCNTCHGLTTKGVDGKPTSPGHKGALGARNSPTSLNSGVLGMQFWDGRAANVEEQAKGPMINPVEMAMPDHPAVEKKIQAIPGYAEQFAKFYADKGGKASIDNIVHAIGAFERTLLTPSRWDDFLKGDVNALNAQEKRGVRAFVGNGCIACHSGMNLGGDTFQKFGLIKPYWDFIDDKKRDTGRHEVTKKEEDKYFFRTSPLRNVADTAPYFHNGSVADLGKAVAIMGETQLGKTLSQQDIDDIVAFLKATSGEVPANAMKVPELPK